jgi:hypothetical protein
MHDILVNVHSLLRWVIVIAGLITVFKAITGVAGNKSYTDGDAKIGLMFMIALDIQFLIGLILLFISPFVNFSEMGNAVIRFFTVEHSLMGIVAITLVHIGRAKLKKIAPEKKQKTALIFFGLAFLVILAMIPWPFREALGRGWF